MLAGSIAFVAIGFWFVIKQPTSDSTVLGNPTLVFIVGLASILFFGLCGILIAKKLTENTPGLVINDEGITDNSSGASAGLILWKDIIEIRKIAVLNQSFLMIIVKNPEEYINRQTGLIKRRLMGINYKTYGSPINISPNGLKCNFDQLGETIINEFNSKKI